MTYRIAVTSSDGEAIDQHFGQAEQFTIIEIDEQKNAWKKIDTRSATVDKNILVLCASSCSGHKHNSIEESVNLLADCTYLLTGKIGKHPYAALKRAGITPLEVSFDLPAAIEKLNQYHKNLIRKGR
ncbi:NifB/NifX family molybdenum-iron cluster-binding protein [Anaerosinus massiliensis]|uniref:NifB/NifX family molybdenum-iron cluster-binding protein n=1 Tax=Massilibacillus massiliensis TaxID=1806837 RepID=UPI000DA5F646|nr:NifB/NifX family molybdenum-iron cluster-binding protein [Massilibacillus massiliensis]